MAFFKCKMCGEPLPIKFGDKLITCRVCGTTQTIPLVVETEKVALLHARANELRLHNEFDKAMMTYENIIAENPKDAEAYWGLLLCRYGIEYVTDTKTNKKIPTCHRTQLKSIFDDSDYKKVIELADVTTRSIYEDEAKVIDGIQKKTLAIIQREKPYDIFICYKETDEHGQRTVDSVIAQDIYDELLKNNYHVFFARISLEDKLGSEYEPYIYAALNSAKVMLVIGTNANVFTSPWVKNEWSRYLDMMGGENKRYLIPCYKNIDAYDLPMEFIPLQAQDLGKVGYMQDLIRGVNKIFNRIGIDAKSFDNEALLKRIEILVADSDYKRANELLDEVLNRDPLNYEAYLYLTFIDFKVKNIEELGKVEDDLSLSSNFKNALNFASGEDRDRLEAIKLKNEQLVSYVKISSMYQDAINKMANNEFIEAKKILKKISFYRDCKELIAKCDQNTLRLRQETYGKAVRYIELYEYDKALDLLNEISDFKDSRDLINNINNLKELENQYQEILDFVGNINTCNTKKCQEAIQKFQVIEDYRDVKDIIDKLHQRMDKIEQKNKNRKTRGHIRIIALIGMIVLIVIGFVSYLVWIQPEMVYKQALDLYKEKKYDEAKDLFSTISNYKDSEMQCNIIDADRYLSIGEYQPGCDILADNDIPVDITYDPNGGSADITHEVKDSGNFYISNKATLEGENFYGWTLEAYRINNKKDEYYCYITLKASYEPINTNTFSIFYDLNGGTATGDLVNTYTPLETVYLPSVVKSGYEFLGWVEKGTDKAPELDMCIPLYSTGNKYFTAMFKELEGNEVSSNNQTSQEYVKQTYQITYDLNGYEIDPNWPTTYESDGRPGDMYLYIGSASKKGYKFVGWEVEGQTSAFSTSITFRKDSGDIHLIAHWTR